LQEVLVLRAHFAAQGARSKTYLPYRPQAAAPDSATAKPQAKITVVAHAQAGVGKTTTCVHLAMSAALEGYRVLVIDMDAQARLTALFKSADSRPDQSVFALLASHYAQQLRADNQRRLDRGETPQPLDTALSAALKRPTQALIRATHWPNIDLIAADMSLSAAEFQLADWRLAARGWPFWAALRETLARDGVLDAYDLIFIDTPPALGQLTLMAVASADIVLVPTAATAAEVAATAAFFDLLHRSFKSLEQGANLAARALGQPDLLFDWGAVRLVLTRYQAVLHSGAASLLHSHLGPGLTPQRQDFTALLDQAGAGAVYEIDYRAFNRETYARARESFDGNYDDFKALLHACWQRDMQG
jgi:chromosome partitioning protein